MITQKREFVQVILEQPKVSFDEEDVPCCACTQREDTEANPIIFCDGCDIAVHAGNLCFSHLILLKSAKAWKALILMKIGFVTAVPT